MKGGIVWLTGLSGSGKSTLANEVARQLTRTRVEVLDGDEIREFVSAGLGFTREDRDTNVHRMAYIARLLAKHGVLVFVAAIAPYAETRTELAQLSAEAGHAFLEIYVNAPLETVAERDVKGLYKRALAGELDHFTGVSDPYEPPPAPHLEIRTDQESLEASATRLIELLVRHGLA